MKVLVTGAYGQLGMKIRDLSADYKHFDFVFTDLDSLDITNQQDLFDFFTEHKPDILINCAAYTAVDKAEDDSENAFTANSSAPFYLANACKANNCKFIHISTDYVFDGSSKVPYREDHTVNPVSVYGKSKFEGETRLLEVLPLSIIIRTSWLYSEYGNNFVKTILRISKDREFLNVVNDQRGTPTYAGDLAYAILEICQKYAVAKMWSSGIYHFSNMGECTWFEFAKEILSLKNSKTTVNPVTSDQFPSKVNRPVYSVLDKSKIIKTYNIQIPEWKVSLAGVIDKFE